MTEPATKICKTRSGPMIVLRTDQFVGRSLEIYGEYCPAEQRMLRQVIKPGMIVVEVGANLGAHSVDMARACAPGAFIAFEPQPRLFQILCANLALNDIGNAIAYPEACGAEEGQAVIPLVNYAKPGNFGGISLAESGQPGIRVRVNAIDDYELPSCGLLKIDVEGHEARVIRGAAATIKRCRPIIYVENDRPGEQQALINLISELGYQMHWHMPRLFEPDNFNGFAEDIFGNVASLNMVCIPIERKMEIEGSSPIDPMNWSSPIKNL